MSMFNHFVCDTHEVWAWRDVIDQPDHIIIGEKRKKLDVTDIHYMRWFDFLKNRKLEEATEREYIYIKKKEKFRRSFYLLRDTEMWISASKIILTLSTNGIYIWIPLWHSQWSGLLRDNQCEIIKIRR